MDEQMLSIFPKNKQDAFLYYLILVALIPLIYLLLGQSVRINVINFFCLIIFCLIFIFYSVKVIRQKRSFLVLKSPAFWLISLMFAWIFISSFSAFNGVETWSFYSEDSIWQYMFYFSAAIAAINLKRENIKYILSFIVIVACLLILIQFAYCDYSIGFVHKNHTGYYLCMTLMISIGLFFCEKNVLNCILSMFSVILHFVSLILNGSMGPIIGIIAFFVVGIIYVLIHRRGLFIKIFSVLVSFVVVVSICDYAPKIRDFRDEQGTTIEKVVDIGIVALNRMGIISNEKMKDIDITPGSGGYGRLFMWKRAYQNMLELPLFGTGVGSWKSYNPDMPNLKPHNELLQYGATAGWVAMLAYLGLIGVLFVKYRKRHQSQSQESFIVLGAIFVYFVQALFGCVMPFHAPIFFALVGVAIKELDLNKKNNKSENQEKIS